MGRRAPDARRRRKGVRRGVRVGRAAAQGRAYALWRAGRAFPALRDAERRVLPAVLRNRPSSWKGRVRVRLKRAGKGLVYGALLYRRSDSPHGRGNQSVYFGEWPCPDPVLAEVEARVFDADTKRPLNAKLTLTGPDAAGSTALAPQGTARFRARVFQRVRASAAGYADLESGVLDTPAVNAFVASVSEEDLQAWATYEKARQLLQGLTLDFSLRRK